MTDVLSSAGPAGTMPQDVPDVQMDSIAINREEMLRRDEEILTSQLILIDEEMGADDLQLLKFVCRDDIGVSKLESADSGLAVFQQLKAQAVFSPHDVTYLMECLGLIHRFDLIRKLGFEDIDAIKEQFPTFNKIKPFRKLMFEIAEDLDESELDKMKFLLSGTVRKKRLQDFKTVLELLVYMEQENILAHQKTEPLIDMLKNIKRTDLVNRIQRFRGQLPRLPAEPRLHQDPRHQAGATGLHIFPAERPTQPPNARPTVNPRLVTDPPVHHQYPVPGGVNISQNRDPSNNAINRSASAGTLSVSSNDSQTQKNEVTWELPPKLVNEIVQTVVREDKWTDFAIELGYTNVVISQYEIQHPDRQVCVRVALEDWCKQMTISEEIAPKLLYVLNSLNFKTVSKRLLKWQELRAQVQRSEAEGQTEGHEIAISTERPPQSQNPQRLQNSGQNINFTVNTGEAQSTHIPVGPPEENIYTSLQSARPMQQTNPGRDPAPIDPIENHQIQMIQNQLNAMNMGQNMMQNAGSQPQPGQQQYQVRSQPIPRTNPPDQPLVFNSAGVPLQQILQQTGLQTGHQQGQPTGTVTRNQMTDAAPNDSLPTYPMSRKPRGWCVIINNRDFFVNDSSGKQMPQRSGTDVDAESLQHVFGALGFIVRRRDNLTDTQMMQYMIDVAHNVDHKNFDCFICCILTHGVLNHLYGTNGKLVSIKDLTSMFQANRCPTLTGKPKLFFLQACQGRDKMTGGELEKDAESVETDSDKEMIPNEADFIIGYATVPGYVSFRSRTHGSWYIRKLCELLEKLSHKEDLLSILVQVNNEVSKANASLEDGRFFKQTPAPLVTLRKKLYFR